MIKTKRSIVLLSMIIIALSICIITGVAFAYFAKGVDKTGQINFGKIEIMPNEPYEVTIPLQDVIPGDKVVDKISFTKSHDREDMYVRIKVLFTTTSSEESIKELVDNLNASHIERVSSDDYTWNDDYLNHYYFYLNYLNNHIIRYLNIKWL